MKISGFSIYGIYENEMRAMMSFPLEISWEGKYSVFPQGFVAQQIMHNYKIS